MLPSEQTDVSVIKSLIISISRYRPSDKSVDMEESVQSMGKVSRFAYWINAVSPELVRLRNIKTISEFRFA